MKIPIHRRSITITDSNHEFICKIRGEAICKLYDVDYTTTINKIIEFAIRNGCNSNDLQFNEIPTIEAVN